MSVLIIGEIGINHNARLETALMLIDQAIWAGFDAVKFQKRNPELYPDRPYNSPLFGTVSYREHKRRLEFSFEDYAIINSHCKRHGEIEWFASCFDIESVDFVAQFKPKYWKIASPCITNLELVEYIGKQVRNSKRVGAMSIMSTGMSTMEDVDEAATSLLNACDWDYSRVAILHCCSEYPTPMEHVNLNVIQTLRSMFPMCQIGYSSHDGGVPVSVAAVALGAKVIEVHITLDRAMPGSDHAASLEREEMERLVRHIRAVETALGSRDKQFYPEEKRIREKVATQRVNS